MNANERSDLQDEIEGNLSEQQDFINNNATEDYYIPIVDKENITLMRVTNFRELFDLEFNPRLSILDGYLSDLQDEIEGNLSEQQDFINNNATEDYYIPIVDKENITLMRVTNFRELFDLEFNPRLSILDGYLRLKMALQLQAKLGYLRVVEWRKSGGNIDIIKHEIAQSNVFSFDWSTCTDKGNPYRQETHQ